MQYFPVMESQSQQSLTTSQHFFIMLIHKFAGTWGFRATLFTLTCSSIRLYPECGGRGGAHIGWTKFGGPPPHRPPNSPSSYTPAFISSYHKLYAGRSEA